MIVTLTGAFQNAGDHLIGARARALLRKYLKDDIVDVTRIAISESTYDLFNKARAVLLTGGPAYRSDIFPRVYNIDLSRIEPNVVPFGLGWRAELSTEPSARFFSPEASRFVTEVHRRALFSSVRDGATESLLRHHGISNVLMTGCPAWYDDEWVERTYVHVNEPKHVVVSAPAAMNSGLKKLIDWIGKRFPSALRTIAYHHGYALAPRSLRLVGAYARVNGWRTCSLAGSVEKMEALYSSCDLHIGYRVHAHLLCLSRRCASVLVSEDTRGTAQSTTLGQVPLVVNGESIDHIQAEVNRHFETRGAGIEQAIEKIRNVQPVMVEFIKSV